VRARDLDGDIDTPALNLFRREWQTYRKVVESNYMFHHEVYGQLHQILVDEAPQPFRFLDIACGDASASVRALRGTRVSHYHGIDLSKPALDLASEALKTLGCPVTLECRNLIEVLDEWNQSVDVAWIGQSLHHFSGPEKLEVMRAVRRIAGERGLFLIWEPASPDGEDRDGWLRRFELTSRPLWTALTPEEWGAMLAHIRAADFPETSSRWRALGQEAGFSKIRELFVAPTNINRMYCFQG
jgi:ubiquinone/menaquinone biosynthesis C-methylase UbiE